MISHENILNVLKKVYDPDLKKDLVTLGMIKKLSVDNKTIKFEIELTTPACPMKEMIQNNCVVLLKEEFGEDINIEISFSSNVTSSRVSQINILPNVKNIICVSSGKGGVGKSTISVSLANALHQLNSKVGILDADIHGPSIPIMLGIKNIKPKIREIKGKNYILPIDVKENFKAMSIGLLVDERQAIVWRGAMVTSALKQFVTDVIWGDLDYLIIDMPPGTGDVQLTLAQTLNITASIIVTTPQKVAVADARKALSMYRAQGINIPIAGIIENMAYFQPSDNNDKKYYIFGKDGAKNLATEYEVPFLGELPLFEQLCENLDNGKYNQETISNNIMKEIAMKLAQEISILNQNKIEQTEN